MNTFLTPVIKGFVDILYPLRKGLSSAEDFELLIAKYGWEAHINNGVMEVVNAAFAIEPTLVSVLEKLDIFINGVNQDRATASLELVLEIKNTIDIISKLSPSGGGLPSPLDQNIFWSEISSNIFSDLLSEYFEKRQPIIYAIFHFSGVISYTKIVPFEANRIPYIQTRIDFGKLGDFFSSPSDLFKTTYGWNVQGDDFNHVKLFAVLERILLSFRLPAIRNLPDDIFANKFLDLQQIQSQNLRHLEIPIIDGISPSDNSLWKIGLVLLPIPDPVKGSGTAKGVAFIPLLQGDLNSTIYFSQEICLKLTGAFDADNAIYLQSYPDRTILESTLSDIDIKAAFELIGDPEKPWVLLGSADSSRIELGGFRMLFAMQGKIIDPEVIFSIGTGNTQTNKSPQLTFTFDPSDSDSFVTNALGEEGLSVDFQSNLIWSSMTGFAFEGQAGFELVLPIHLALGPVEIRAIYLTMRGGGNNVSSAKADIGIGLKGELGPLTFVIENIGATLLLNPVVSPEKGLLGDHDLIFDFKPPEGVGLSINAAAIKGGGYLFFDDNREEYGGNLELVISEWIALKATGLITTKLPDGSKGFSLLIIITAEFGTGIQLGFGFTLLGVGGLLGLNRTVKIQPLAEGVRTGAADRILFPQNVVANAPRIISDLRAFFPAKNDQFLIGPMAKIGYGTPTLINLSLGVIIEFPTVSITILGVLKAALPDEQAEVLKLQVNFIGRIEPSNKLLWFYAELFDSRILFLTIEGGMGLLVNWGDQSNFVLTVGGFHPRYTPPPLPFPEPPRLAITLLNETNAKIRIEGYFAVTSNTAQFGARAELYFGFNAFNVDGHISFDALFQFDPFYFNIEFSVGMAVKVFGFGLFTFSVSGMLEGPAKWHIKGSAKKKLTWLGPTIRIPIDTTWGEERQTELPPIEILPLIQREFEALSNWEAVIPTSSNILVTLRQLGENVPAPTEAVEVDNSKLVLHPVGKLRISQRKMPLNLELDKLGSQRPNDVNKLSVTANIEGGELLATPYVKEKFAQGEFRDLNETNKLSSPGFELYDSGIEVKPEGEQLKTSMAVKRIIRYETIIIDNYFKRHQFPFFTDIQVAFSGLYASLFGHFLKGSAVSKSTLSENHRQQLQPNNTVIQVLPNQYSVAFNDTNKPIDFGAMSFGSQANATDYMRDQIRENPNAANQIHVIPNTEINIAA